MRDTYARRRASPVAPHVRHLIAAAARGAGRLACPTRIVRRSKTSLSIFEQNATLPDSPE